MQERLKLKSADKLPFYIQIIFFSLITLLTLFVVFPVRKTINAQIIQQKKLAIELLENKIDHKITYDSISPSILHAFEIKGLKISSFDEPENYLFKIEKVRLRFNIFKFTLSNPLSAFIGLTIINSDFTYDSSKKEALSGIFDSLNSSSVETSSGYVLPESFTIKGKNLSVKYKNEAFSIVLSSLFFSLGSSEQGDLTITAKTETAFKLFNLPAPSPVADLSVETGMTFSGRLSPDLLWADIDINAKNFNSNVFSINRIKWNLKYNDPGLLVLTKTGDNIPADLALTADIPENSLKIDLYAQDFIFNEYFEESEVLEKYHFILRSVVSGIATGEFRFKTGDFLYSCDIEVRDIQNLTEFPIEAAVDLKGINKKITIADSLIKNRKGNLGYKGTLELMDKLPSLNGELSLSDAVFKDYAIGANLSINTDSGGNYTLTAKSANINELKLRQISAVLQPYGDSLDFKLSAGVLSPDGSLDFLNSEGNIQTGSNYFIQAAVDTENLPVQPFLDLIPAAAKIPGSILDLRLTTSFFLSGNLEEMAFASPRIRLEDTGSENKTLSFALSGNNSGFRINDINLDWLENNLTGRISADLSQNNDLIINSQFIYNNISIEPSGVFDRNGNISLHGDYGLKFSFIKNFGEGYNISLVIDRFPFFIKNEAPSYLSLKTIGIYNSTADWKLLVNNCSLDKLPVPSGSGKIDSSLFLTPDGGNIYNLVYSDAFSELRGQGSLLIDELSSTPKGRMHLTAVNPEDNEFYNLQLILEKDNIKGDLKFSNLPLSRLSGKTPLEGYINGAATARGTTSNPELDFSLSSTGATLNNEPISFKASLSYTDLSLLINDIDGTSGNIIFNNIGGQFDFRHGRHFIKGSADHDSRFLSIISEFNAEAETVGINSIMEAGGILSQDFNAALDITKFVVNEENRDLWGIRVKKENLILTGKGGPDNSISGSMYDDGYFTVIADDPFPLTFDASGTYDSGSIDAKISNINYGFNDASIPYFHVYEGRITGGLHVIGDINDPDLFGQININNAVFEPPVIEDITEAFSTSIFFREKNVTMPATRIPTNNGMVFMTIDAVMDRWLPRTYDLNLKIPDNQAISAMYYRSPYYVFGFVEGDFRVFGDFITMRIDGDIKLINGGIILNDNLDIKSVGKPTDYIIAELRTTTGENNQLFWPSRELPIVNGFLGSDDTLTMTYDSGAAGLALNGELTLKGGEVFYFEKNFYIKEGRVKFGNNASESIDPLLNMKAEIRDVNSAGELTRIYLIADESPLSKFAPRFESDPALSTAEIISILGGNFMDSLSTSGSFDLTDAVLTSVDLFTQLWVLQGIEDSLKNTTGLDLLSIRSSFLTNIVEDKFVNLSGNTGISNFAKYLDNTTLFLGKYFTDDIFLQGLFQFDLYNNSGYSEGLNIDSEVKLEWESPVANIELSIFPDFYDPVKGLSRTSVGLSWRFSY